MSHIYYYCCSFFFLFFSCSEEVKEIIKESNKITFHLGFPTPNERFSNVILEDGKELVYFVDPTTTKQIKFFNLNGELSVKIQLDSLYKRGREARCLLMLSP